MMRKVGIAVLGIFAAFLIQALPVRAETVDVTIGVGDTVLQVSGKTSPDAFVTISKDGGVIGTVQANSSGVYSQTFPAQDPGLHTLSVYAHTTGGNNTDTVTLTVNIAEHTTTTVSIFLPSTITVQDTDLAYGEPLILEGEAAPSSTVTAYIDNTIYGTATTDAQGNWTASFSTAALSSGQHEFFVRVTDGFGEQSYPTATRTFSLAAKATQPTSPSSGRTPSAPTITFPTPGLVWHEPTITITGSSGSEVQIELWDGDTIIGSVWSGRNGQWSLLLRLDPKEYSLRARACLDGRCSAFSPTIHFEYEPTSPISPTDQPLHISIPRAFFTVFQYERVPLKAIVLDGQPPYTAKIRWGDGTTETRKYLYNELLFPHSYSKPGKYTVIVDVEDSQGRKNQIYFSIHVKPLQRGLPPIISIFILALLALLWLLLYRKYKKKG